MKKIAVLATSAALAFGISANAAQASATHECFNSYGGSVTASIDTSCPFSNSILQAWIIGRCWRYRICSGHVFSTVTNRRYTVLCQEIGHYPMHIYCGANGNNAWIRFVERND